MVASTHPALQPEPLSTWPGQYHPVDRGSVLGMVVAGPLGAMVGAGLAVAATQPNANMFPLLQRGRHTIANVSLPRDGISAEHQEYDGDGAILYVSQVAYQCRHSDS